MFRNDNGSWSAASLVIGGVLLASVHGAVSYAILTILLHMPYREAIATAYLIGGTAYFERAHAAHVAQKVAVLLDEHMPHPHHAHVVTESQCKPLAPPRVSYVTPWIEAEDQPKVITSTEARKKLPPPTV